VYLELQEIATAIKKVVEKNRDKYNTLLELKGL